MQQAICGQKLLMSDIAMAEDAKHCPTLLVSTSSSVMVLIVDKNAGTVPVNCSNTFR